MIFVLYGLLNYYFQINKKKIINKINVIFVVVYFVQEHQY